MLTLQPLIENAIYHGIQALEAGGTISVVGEIEDDHIQIIITNPVPPSSLRRISTGNKIAVANITHRLHLLFGRQANLSAEATGSDVVNCVFPYVESDL